MRALIGHPWLLRSCVLRIAIIWVAIRLGIAGASAALKQPGPSLGPTGSILLALTVSGIVVLDAAATRELLFLRNLGLSRPWLVGVTLLTTLVLESFLRLVL